MRFLKFILILLIVFFINCEGDKGLTGLPGEKGDPGEQGLRGYKGNDGKDAEIKEYTGTLKITNWSEEDGRWDIEYYSIKDNFVINVYIGRDFENIFNGFEPSSWAYWYDKFNNYILVYIYPQTEPFVVETGKDYRITLTY